MLLVLLIDSSTSGQTSCVNPEMNNYEFKLWDSSKGLGIKLGANQTVDASLSHTLLEVTTIEADAVRVHFNDATNYYLVVKDSLSLYMHVSETKFSQQADGSYPVDPIYSNEVGSDGTIYQRGSGGSSAIGIDSVSNTVTYTSVTADKLVFFNLDYLAQNAQV